MFAECVDYDSPALASNVNNKDAAVRDLGKPCFDNKPRPRAK